ncbi:MAG: glycosyltransferase [Novosphingobium sp.]
MSEHSARLLTDFYGASPEQIVFISHGVPDRPFGRSAHFKSVFGFEGRKLLMTFGLLSPGKGIESVIEALPVVVAEHPDVLYCIVGATHPKLLLREGEAYRERLHSLATELGVESHICWIEAFLETEELLDLIEAADIYVTPYPGAGQSTSGTLSYAFALGKAVVSTPYVHATELLAENHGVLVPFGDKAAMAKAINVLLDDPDQLEALQKRAYERGRTMIWPVFSERCLDLFAETKVVPVTEPEIGPIGIKGLLRACDEIGIIQHSIHDVVDYNHGYCLDDNARGLMLTNRLGVEAEPHRSRLSCLFARFVQDAWNHEGQNFRNFMDSNGRWLEDVGSEDSSGRALWALGATAHEGGTTDLQRWAREQFDRTATVAPDFGSPRATAFAMLGADSILERDASHGLARRIIENGAAQLLKLYRAIARPGWLWFEDRLAYDNCRLAEAMIVAGQRLGNTSVTECGIEALTWINTLQIAPLGHFRPVGSESFGRAYEEPRPFDQQAVEIWAAIEAAAIAYDVTRDRNWVRHAQRAYAWFGGANDRGLAVGDRHSGTCRDGITPQGLNLNQGAESILSYQLATCAIRTLIAKAD